MINEQNLNQIDLSAWQLISYTVWAAICDRIMKTKQWVVMCLSGLLDQHEPLYQK